MTGERRDGRLWGSASPGLDFKRTGALILSLALQQCICRLSHVQPSECCCLEVPAERVQATPMADYDHPVLHHSSNPTVRRKPTWHRLLVRHLSLNPRVSFPSSGFSWTLCHCPHTDTNGQRAPVQSFPTHTEGEHS
jgi:hypothetical protein